MSDVKKILAVVQAMADVIKEAGRIPSGHLYARVMDRMSLAFYNQVITILKDAGIVKEVAHELIWTGPSEAKTREVLR